MCRPTSSLSSDAKQQQRPGSVTLTASKKFSSQSSYSYASSKVFFRIGRMRFGYHGVFGILATFTTWWALYQQRQKETHDEESPFVGLSLLTSCVCSTLVAYWASNHMMQIVPPDTNIYKNIIVAPHVDAFTMTVYLIYYINIRCLKEYIVPAEDDGSIIITFVYNALLLLAYLPFVTHKKLNDWNYKNLNTYIFGIPRLVGVTCDFTKSFFGESTISTYDLLFIVQSLLLASFAYSISFRIRGKCGSQRYQVISQFVYVAITGMLGYLLSTIVYPDIVDSYNHVFPVGVEQILNRY